MFSLLGVVFPPDYTGAVVKVDITRMFLDARN